MMLHLIIIYYLVVNPFQGTQLLGMDMQLLKERKRGGVKYILVWSPVLSCSATLTWKILDMTCLIFYLDPIIFQVILVHTLFPWFGLPLYSNSVEN